LASRLLRQWTGADSFKAGRWTVTATDVAQFFALMLCIKPKSDDSLPVRAVGRLWEEVYSVGRGRKQSGGAGCGLMRWENEAKQQGRNVTVGFFWVDGENEQLFEEDQHFRQTWLWMLVLAILAVLLVASLLAPEGQDVSWIVLGILLATALLFYCMRLSVLVDTEAVLINGAPLTHCTRPRITNIVCPPPFHYPL